LSELVDLTGQQFGRWTVVRRYDSQYAQARWECVCECGTIATRYGGALRSGRTKSCGCIARRHHRPSGSYHAPTYRSWGGMLQRWLNPNNPCFQKHGGRIQVCDRWNPHRGGSFENFVSDMGTRPEGRSLFRIDDTKDFDVENCRWMNKREHHALQRQRTWQDWGLGYSRPVAEIPPRFRT